MTKRKSAPRRYDGAEYRRAILEAAIETFGLLGYEGTSTRKIATAAGIEPGHLAYYYPTKEELWRDAVTMFASGVETRLAQAMAQYVDRSPADTARAVLPEFLRYCADHPRLTRLMLQEFSMHSPRHDWLIETFGKPIWILLQPLFQRLREERRLFGAQPEVAYFAFVGAALVTFGNPEVTRRIAGIAVPDASMREQHIEYIMRPILQKATTVAMKQAPRAANPQSAPRRLINP